MLFFAFKDLFYCFVKNIYRIYIHILTEKDLTTSKSFLFVVCLFVCFYTVVNIKNKKKKKSPVKIEKR